MESFEIDLGGGASMRALAANGFVRQAILQGNIVLVSDGESYEISNRFSS